MQDLTIEFDEDVSFDSLLRHIPVAVLNSAYRFGCSSVEGEVIIGPLFNKRFSGKIILNFGNLHLEEERAEQLNIAIKVAIDQLALYDAKAGDKQSLCELITIIPK